MDREEWLRMLITAVCEKHPNGTLEWRIAMNRLLIEIQELQGLAKCFHADYHEVLNDTLIQVSQKICDFRPNRSFSFTKSLVGWINQKLRLKYRVLDLYSNTPLAQTEKTNTETFIEQYPDSRPCNLLELEAEAEEWQRQQTIEIIGKRVRNYIEQDPEGKLSRCYPRNFPDCNCQILSQRLLLKDTPDKLAVVARELRVPYQTIAAHWKRKARPLLEEIAAEIGYSPSFK